MSDGDPPRPAHRARWWLAGSAWFLFVVAIYFREAWRLLAGGVALDPYAIRTAVLPTAVLALPLAGVGLVVAFSRRRGRGATGPAVASVACGILLLLVLGLALVSRPLHGTLLPWLGEALRRAAGAVGGAALVVAAAWPLGGLVLRAVGWPRSSVGVSDRGLARERLLFRVALGFGALSYVSLALALAGLYRPRLVVLLLASLAAVGIARTVRRAVLSRPLGEHVAARLGVPPRFALAPGGLNLLWALIAVLGLGLALIAALAPEVEYDALWYHLWLPRLWLQHGRPVDVLSEYVTLYPLTWELIYGNALVTGGPVAAKLLHFGCLLLTALTAWQFTDRFFRPASPWLAAAVLVTVPLVFWEGTTAYIDLALALYVTLGLYALLRYLEHEHRRWLWLTALSLGLAVSVKHLGLVVLALVGTGLIVRAVRQPSGRVRRVAAPVTVGLVAFVLALPWYWRAWVASGNPFFPEMFKLFGARPAARWDAVTEGGLDAFKARFGFPRSAATLVLLPWNLTQHAAAFGGCLGPLFLAALPWFGPRNLTAARWLLFVVVGYLAIWASPISSFQARFLVPIVPVLAVLCAHALSRAFAGLRRPGRRRVAHAVVAVILLAGLPPFIPLHEGDKNGWAGWLTHVVREVPLPVVVGREPQDDYLRRRVASYGAWRYLAAASPPDSLVLDVGGGDNLYATRARIPVDATLARGTWAEGRDAAATVLGTFARLHVTHLVIDKEWLRRMAAEGAILGSPDFRREHLTLEYEDGQALVYRVPPAKAVTMQRSFLPNWRNASTGW